MVIRASTQKLCQSKIMHEDDILQLKILCFVRGFMVKIIDFVKLFSAPTSMQEICQPNIMHEDYALRCPARIIEVVSTDTPTQNHILCVVLYKSGCPTHDHISGCIHVKLLICFVTIR